MVSTKVEGSDRPMALKIMAKSHIIESDQQIQVMREKQALMSMPLHPFIVELYGTYQVQTLYGRTDSQAKRLCSIATYSCLCACHF